MDLVVCVEFNTNLLLIESPINVHGVQRDSLVPHSGFGDIPPLDGSKPLEDEEDKSEGKILEEAEA